jgi:hypothetical protein
VRIHRINRFLHHVLAPFLRDGDLAVDGTVGNGHDALFLARAIGEKGRLYGFDVQGEAVEKTRSRLLAAGIGEERFTLLQRSHEELDRYVPRGIGAAVYNLGYLPGGGRRLTTGRESSIGSIGKALELIRPEGVVSITLYYGHDGGREEAEGLLDYAAALDPARFKVLHLAYTNLPNDPPAILLIQSSSRRAAGNDRGSRRG